MNDFEQILRKAHEIGASDIHLKVNAPVMFRVERELRPAEGLKPTETWITEVLNRIVPDHLRESLLKNHEADFAIALEGAGRFRANVFQQRGSFVIALRLVRTMIRNFGELHLPDALKNISEAPRGIILLTGAPGAGKSTTLAAMIEHLNATVRKHIITLEDPIEYYFEDKLSIIEQREIGLDTATFATGLHNILRQDPDVLVIGEMRDADSVATAVSAANVGTLAISTLHTSDTARSIRRILEFFPGSEREQARRQIAANLYAVVCQKLVRTKTGDTLPAVEILINNATVAKLIETDSLEKLSAALELGTTEGMQTFDQSLRALVEMGVVSTAEALMHSPNPDTFRMKLQGVSLTESHRILNVRR